MPTIAQHVLPEQENVPPVNFVVNVCNVSRNVMANHVNGSAKVIKEVDHSLLVAGSATD